MYDPTLEGFKRYKQLENYREIGKRVKEIILREGYKPESFLIFGSVVKGKFTANSDIDILVVIKGISYEEAVRLKAKIYKEIDAPLELHIVNEREFKWYKRFLDVYENI